MTRARAKQSIQSAVCELCGSEEIEMASWSFWSVEDQRWRTNMLADPPFGEPVYCHSCGQHSSAPKMIDVEEKV